VIYVFFLAASIGDVSVCNHFLQEHKSDHSRYTATLRLYTHTPEKASHNMLETRGNSHCNVTIIGYCYHLDIELPYNVKFAVLSSIRHFTHYLCIFHNQQCQHVLEIPFVNCLLFV